MSLIKPKLEPELSNVKIKLPGKLIEEINDYCSFAGISDISYFLAEATEYIFNKDSAWKKYRKSKQN